MGVSSSYKQREFPIQSGELTPPQLQDMESCLQGRPRGAAHSGPALTILLALGEHGQVRELCKELAGKGGELLG